MVKMAAVVTALTAEDLADLRRRYAYSSRDMARLFDHIEAQEREVTRISAGFREASRRAERAGTDYEALTEMFETATGQTPEEWLGIEDGAQI